VILPARYANDLKDVPETSASFEKALHREFAGAYTGIGVHHAAMTQNLQDLNRQGHQVVDLLVEEAKLACAELPPVGPAGFTVLQLIAQISGRVFVGLPLSRNPEWIGMNIGYLFDSFGAAARLTSWPWWCRPFVALFAKETRSLQKHREKAALMLKPVIEQRIQDHERGAVKNESDRPVDMIQWTLENRGFKARTAEEHMEIQLALLSVSLLGTTILTSFVLYEIAAHPELVSALREEITNVRRENGGSLTKSTLPKLRLLDSFIKETQRLNATTAVMLNRMVRKETTLSDGTILPAGIDVAVNAMEVNRSEKLWKNADTFDGFRYVKLRNDPGADSKYQLIKSDVNALNFGLGGQVCPGRFFAGAEMKVMIAEILSNYDISFQDKETPV
ncbi:cytochrome P450, partial [Lophiotrema nucula]